MSAQEKLLKRLQSGKTVTGLQALNWWGLYRLSDAVWKLRKKGYDVQTKMKQRGKKVYAQYKL